MSQTIEQAKRVLRGEAATTEACFALAKALKRDQKFDLARRLLGRAAAQGTPDDAFRRKIAQQRALCTGKDSDLPVDRRHSEASALIQPVLKEAEEFALRAAEGRAVTEAEIGEHQETFGIAGAIEKRWWDVEHKPEHLTRAFQLYERGYLLGAKCELLPDNGYTAINAAFMLDLLAQADDSAQSPALAEEKREQARLIRGKIISKVKKLPEAEHNWWTLTTLAEACFGRSDYADATKWLKKAMPLKGKVDSWEYETTVKQLARLATLQAGGEKPGEDSAAWGVLTEFVGGDQAGLRTAFRGKVGLALSGGGFRASLFHIGVLARLAELDMLRHVEVLSCVSGGSIIGALYYLKLRNLLESKRDQPSQPGAGDEITSEDYLNLVHEMEREFMEAIQSNPRMRVFSEVAQLLARTERMGELLDETLYGPAAGVGSGQRPLLRDLIVRVKEDPEFRPKYGNWKRRNKVPILIINATTLNTGHNWQFTASFMGESPNNIDPEVDGNERLRRMYYHEAPSPHDDMPLGRAVASSAAVPGLFRPVQLSGLYPDRDIELVDGGVHDNQGVGGLREQDCTVFLISDASGQLVSEPHPARNELTVLMRSNDTLMARVRELQYKELLARKRAGLLSDFMFIHLKKDLLVEPVDWRECDLIKESHPRPGARPDTDDLTRYGVRGKVQDLLSGIRTDLDAFCEGEAYALMASGYRMTAWDFAANVTTFKTEATADSRWRFLQIDRLVWHPARSDEFLAVLKLAGALLGKGPSLSPYASRFGLFGWGLFTLLVALPALAVLGVVAWRLAYGEWLWWTLACFLALPTLAILVGIFAVGSGGIYSATCKFDRCYLDKGSLKNLLPTENAEGR